MLEYQDWMDKARCKDIQDPDIFFPPRDKDLYRKIALEAKSYCFGINGKDPCPVRAECLWTAIKDEEQHGIWGGLSHRERNAQIRKWHRQYRNQMTLEEYIFQIDKKEHTNGSKQLGSQKIS